MKEQVTLTPKQKAFADTLINNPKMSGTQAALKVYGKPDKPTTVGTAQQLAHTNLMKPNIQIYLSKHIDKAKNRVVELIDSDKEEIALRAADSVLDRALGKATQRTEVTTQGISLNIDLTSSLDTEE